MQPAGEVRGPKAFVDAVDGAGAVPLALQNSGEKAVSARQPSPDQPVKPRGL